MRTASDELRRLVSHHGFHLEEFLEAELAPFAAIAGLLVAAERRFEVGACPVQVHIAGAQLRRDFPRMLELTQELFGSADSEFKRGTTDEDQLPALLDMFGYFNGVTTSRREQVHG